MLMPQELKKHDFEHALRGYSTTEVDEYIQFICDKYEELYRANTDLERKLVAALRLVDEKLNRNTADTDSASDASLQAERILQEAERQKKRIVSDAEEYADRIIADADAHVAKQAQALEEMKQAVLAFRDDLYARYSRQIDQIEELACAVQDGTITVPAPVRGTLTPEAQKKPEIPAEEAQDTSFPASDPEAETENEPENLLVFPLESKEDPQDDGVDEEELAATDEALAFFEDFDDAEEQTPAKEIPEAEEDELIVYEDELLLAAQETEPAQDPDEDEDEDEYGDAVIPGGEPIGDDEDPLAGFDERIASLLGLPSSSPEAAGDEFSEEFLQITEEEAAENVPSEESDDALLRELRQAFNLQLEAFDQEDSSKKKEEEEKNEDFSFLPEEVEKEEEPLRFFDRLTGHSSEKKKKDK